MSVTPQAGVSVNSIIQPYIQIWVLDCLGGIRVCIYIQTR